MLVLGRQGMLWSGVLLIVRGSLRRQTQVWEASSGGGGGGGGMVM